MSCKDPRHCTRAQLIQDERLIDLDEWAEMHGYLNPFPIPSGITVELWKQINRIPFRLAGKVTSEQRLQGVVRRAQQCLKQRFPDYLECERDKEVQLVFAAPLPASAGARGHTPLSLVYGPCGCQPRAVTIGLHHAHEPGQREDSPMLSDTPRSALKPHAPGTLRKRRVRTDLGFDAELE